jgi:cytochrome bd-type quinol oxidase subunit 1
MDPTAALMGGPNPFAALTFIAAPALLTNASSLLLLGTTNRLARAVDRVRALASQLEHLAGADNRLAQIELDLMALAEQRVRIIVRAMTAFYLAVGSFAFGTMLALIGAALVAPSHDDARTWVLRLTIGACVIGVAAIMSGSLALVFESRITFRILTEEAGLVRRRFQPGPIA